MRTLMRLRLIVLAAGALIVQSTIANAGYVSASLDSVLREGSWTEMGMGSGSSMAPVEDDPVPQPLRLPEKSADVPPASVFGSSGGMTSPTPDSNSSQGAGLVVIHIADESQLSVWLGREGRAHLPPPLVTRIFHVPRFA